MTAAIDSAIHPPNRLRLCVLLAGVSDMEFATARAALDVSDSVLSKHVRVLEEAGYVAVRKGAIGGRTRTWLALTRGGRGALDGHLAALKRLIAEAETTVERLEATRA